MDKELPLSRRAFRCKASQGSRSLPAVCQSIVTGRTRYVRRLPGRVPAGSIASLAGMSVPPQVPNFVVKAWHVGSQGGRWAGVLMSLVGFGGIAGSVAGWRGFLSRIEPLWIHSTLYGSVVLLGVLWFVAGERRHRREEPAVVLPVTHAAPAEAQTPRVIEERREIGRVHPASAQEAVLSRPVSSLPRLKALRSEGVRLRRNGLSFGHVGVFAAGARTAPKDVEIWTNKVRRVLRAIDPSFVEEFDHQPPAALFARIHVTETWPRADLQDLIYRLGVLDGIIGELELTGAHSHL